MKKFINILVILFLILALSSCKNDENMSSIVSAQLSTEISTNSIFDESWSEIQPNVYDISSTFKLPSNITVSNIDLQHYYVIGYDHQSSEHVFIPINKVDLTLNTTQAIRIPEINSGSGKITKWNLIKDYFIFEKETVWQPNKTIKIYKSNDGLLVKEYETNKTTKLSTYNDKIVIILNESNMQYIQLVDLLTNTKTELMKWDVSKKTETPSFETIKIGKKGLAFIGTIYPYEDSQSTLCFGLVDKSKDLIEIRKNESFSFLEYENGIMIFDKESTYGSNAEKLGHFEMYDANTLKRTILNPITKNEAYSRIHLSKNGKYLLTGGLLEDNHCLRLYDTCNNKIINEYSIKININDPTLELISIHDNERFFIIVIKGKSVTKTFLIKF